MKPIIYILILLIALSCDEPYVNKPIPDDPNIYPDVKNGEELDLLWKAERFIPMTENHGDLQSLKFLIKEEKVIVARDIFIEAYNKIDGSLLWRTEVAPVSGDKNIAFARSDEIIYDNNSIFIIGDYMIYKLDIISGVLLWQTELKGISFATRHESLCHSEEAIYITERGVDDPAHLYAISKADGSVLWKTEDLIEERKVKPGGVLVLGPAAYSLSNNKLYLGTKLHTQVTYEGSLICVDASTGEKEWETKVELDYTNNILNGINTSKVQSNATDADTEPKIVEDGIIFRTGLSISKISFNGEKLWSSFFHYNNKIGTNNQSGGELIGNMFYDFAYEDGSFGAEFDINSGKMTWSGDLSSKLSKASLAFFTHHYDETSRTLFILTDGMELVGFNIDTKQRTWDLNLGLQQYWENDKWNKAECWGSYTVEGDRVYILGTKYIFCYKGKQN